MKTIWKDLVATALVAVVGVYYVGYLWAGDMPLVEDARGMSAVGLLLGTVAFLVMRAGDATDRLGKSEIGLAGISLALGIVALLVAETAAAEVMLAVFMASIAVVWIVELADHVGVLHHTGQPA